MPLTDTAVRGLKPRDRAFKVADEKGLSLQITPAGGRLWKVKFQVAGRAEKKLSLGSNPDLSMPRTG